MPRKSPQVAPTCFVPSCPADFVGQAGKVETYLDSINSIIDSTMFVCSYSAIRA